LDKKSKEGHPSVSGQSELALALGYDPGGNRRHGVAAIHVDSNGSRALRCATVTTAQEAIDWFWPLLDRVGDARVGLGIDTLTALCTGGSGWRPADGYLRRRYGDVVHSVVSANSLYGAMALNGLSVAIALRTARSNLVLTETHPKVLYFECTRVKHEFTVAGSMNAELSEWARIEGGDTPQNDHEWDAAVSAWAVEEGAAGRWAHDLHALPLTDGQLVWPAGPSAYFWPRSPDDH
tara:strand:+ start:1514 stop:2221 length:708 start_codon:yes stop_codon:yes gene_type:complete